MSNIKHPRAKNERGVRVKSKADIWTDVTDNNISDLFKKKNADSNITEMVQLCAVTRNGSRGE